MFTKQDLQDLSIDELLNINEIVVSLIKEKRSQKPIDNRIKVGCTVEVETGERKAGFPCIDKFIIVKINRTTATCRLAFGDKLYAIHLNRMKFINEKAIDLFLQTKS